MPGIFDRLQEDLDQREKMAGMSPADLLSMPSDEVAVVQTLARRGDLSLDDLAAALGLPAEAVAATLERLRERGFARPVELPGGTVYRTYFARKRPGRGMDNIWDQLGQKLGEKGGEGEREGEGEGESLSESEGEGEGEGEGESDGSRAGESGGPDGRGRGGTG